MNTKAKESRKLHWAKSRLEELGYYVCLSRASLGPFDLVAMNNIGVRLVQVKCNKNPDEVERERIREFRMCPANTSKEVWRFDDGCDAPSLEIF